MLQTQVNTLQFERRINSVKEYSISILQVLEFRPRTRNNIYITYKCELFKCPSRLIPKNTLLYHSRKQY